MFLELSSIIYENSEIPFTSRLNVFLGFGFVLTFVLVGYLFT